MKFVRLTGFDDVELHVSVTHIVTVVPFSDPNRPGSTILLSSDGTRHGHPAGPGA